MNELDNPRATGAGDAYGALQEALAVTDEVWEDAVESVLATVTPDDVLNGMADYTASLAELTVIGDYDAIGRLYMMVRLEYAERVAAWNLGLKGVRK